MAFCSLEIWASCMDLSLEILKGSRDRFFSFFQWGLLSPVLFRPQWSKLCASCQIPLMLAMLASMFWLGFQDETFGILHLSSSKSGGFQHDFQLCLRMAIQLSQIFQNETTHQKFTLLRVLPTEFCSWQLRATQNTQIQGVFGEPACAQRCKG